MDGVTILNIKTYQELTLGAFVFVGMFLAVAYIMCVLTLCALYKCGKHGDKIGCAVLFVLVTALIVWGLNEMWQEYNTIYTDYYVTVDDTVSMNEFMDRYEIMQCDGKILTVRERELASE